MIKGPACRLQHPGAAQYFSAHRGDKKKTSDDGTKTEKTEKTTETK